MSDVNNTPAVEEVPATGAVTKKKAPVKNHKTDAQKLKELQREHAQLLVRLEETEAELQTQASKAEFYFTKFDALRKNVERDKQILIESIQTLNSNISSTINMFYHANRRGE
jgi:hypothetical protein